VGLVQVGEGKNAGRGVGEQGARFGRQVGGRLVAGQNADEAKAAGDDRAEPVEIEIEVGLPGRGGRR
jgi:hypothetical protein